MSASCFSPDSAQTAHNDASQGRIMASVSKVEQAGHMVCFPSFTDFISRSILLAGKSGCPGAAYKTRADNFSYFGNDVHCLSWEIEFMTRSLASLPEIDLYVIFVSFYITRWLTGRLGKWVGAFLGCRSMHTIWHIHSTRSEWFFHLVTAFHFTFHTNLSIICMFLSSHTPRWSGTFLCIYMISLGSSSNETTVIRLTKFMSGR